MNPAGAGRSYSWYELELVGLVLVELELVGATAGRS